MRTAFRYGSILGLTVAATAWSSLAHAQDMGKPPPEAEKVVAGPGKAAEAPKLAPSPDATNAAVSAGGLSSTGNSRMVAFTGSGNFDWRGGNNGFGASLVGNYGKSAPPDGEMETTTENFQGRVRYDRYVIEDASVFMMATGRHDRFQGLAFRLNLDPGFKYLFVNRPNTALWVEAGYDLQYDTRTRAARDVVDDMGVVIDRLDKHETDHSARVFLGFRHAFNEATALSNGIEYLQSFVETERYRVNYDVLFTAKVWGDLALGVGFNARYDNQPLPEKEKLDTTSTLSLIYAYSSEAK